MLFKSTKGQFSQPPTTKQNKKVLPVVLMVLHHSFKSDCTSKNSVSDL